jgi:predicted aspartyl protease
MIKGIVNFRRVPVIQLPVLDHKAAPRLIAAIIDTGFNGALTLPREVIDDLGLSWRSRGSATLANGSNDFFDIYTGTVIWDGKQRRVLVECANAPVGWHATAASASARSHRIPRGRCHH